MARGSTDGVRGPGAGPGVTPLSEDAMGGGGTQGPESLRSRTHPGRAGRAGLGLCSLTLALRRQEPSENRIYFYLLHVLFLSKEYT